MPELVPQIRKGEPLTPERDVVSGWAYRRVRRIAVALALVIAVPSLLLVAVLIGLSPAIRVAVESMGTDAAGVPVGLEEARVNVIGGVHLTRFSLGSPMGFREVRTFRFGRCDASVSPVSLFGPTVE